MTDKENQVFFNAVKDKKIRLCHWPEETFIIPSDLIDKSKGLLLGKIGGISQMSFFINSGFTADEKHGPDHRWEIVK